MISSAAALTLDSGDIVTVIKIGGLPGSVRLLAAVLLPELLPKLPDEVSNETAVVDDPGGVHPSTMQTKNDAQDNDRTTACDERLFFGFMENPLVGLSRMFIILASLSLFVGSICFLFLKPTLLQSGQTPLCA